MDTTLINENEQWKLNGDCSKCRRENYCSKPCSANKKSVDLMIMSAINEKFEKTGINDVMKSINKGGVNNVYFK